MSYYILLWNTIFPHRQHTILWQLLFNNYIQQILVENGCQAKICRTLDVFMTHWVYSYTVLLWSNGHFIQLSQKRPLPLYDLSCFRLSKIVNPGPLESKGQGQNPNIKTPFIFIYSNRRVILLLGVLKDFNVPLF